MKQSVQAAISRATPRGFTEVEPSGAPGGGGGGARVPDWRLALFLLFAAGGLKRTSEEVLLCGMVDEVCLC